MKISAKKLKLAAVGTVVVASILVGAYALGYFTPQPTVGQYDAFAKCLAQKGVVLYGLKTCPHCIEQKELFGSSFQYLTYVECSEQQALCTAKGVQFVPAWEVDGRIEVGVKTLAELANETGCPL